MLVEIVLDPDSTNEEFYEIRSEQQSFSNIEFLKVSQAPTPEGSGLVTAEKSGATIGCLTAARAAILQAAT